MVLGTLLDRQADRVDPSLEFDPADVVDGLLRIERVQPGMLWFADGVGPVPIGEAASRVAQAGWWVDIIVAAKGGFWHVLEVGSVYPERIVLDEPADRRSAPATERLVTREVARSGCIVGVGRAVPPPARPTSFVHRPRSARLF